jgi:DNA-directed RNA polymerase specialized sigma24 family protein
MQGRGVKASRGVDPQSTVSLVRRAKRGDRDAWTELVDRYYDLWLNQYHGHLGPRMRRVCDTEDLVHSALADALEDIGGLRNESAFFVWVTTIIRHKLAGHYRKTRKEVALDQICGRGGEPVASHTGGGEAELTDS